MATSPSTGAIVVTAPRAIMDRVQAFMEAQNQRLSRQVTVNVQVLSVDLNDGSDTRFDLQAIANDLIARGLAVSLGTQASIANSAAPGIGFAVTSGRAQGTEAVLQALASRGRVSVRTATTVTTLNGIPAPVNVTNTRGYLAEIALSQVPGFGGGGGGGVGSTGVQAALRPGSVTTGFSLNILPRIDRDGQSLLMQFSVNISELVGPRDGFNEFSAPGLGAIQLPNINSRSFVQQAEVQSGQTIIVTGFERAGETAERQGAVFSEFIGAGGSQVGSRRRTSIVVLMTPRIVSSRPAISME
jgi:type IVB pilus formation R64 PilN family outer membrane protein